DGACVGFALIRRAHLTRRGGLMRSLAVLLLVAALGDLPAQRAGQSRDVLLRNEDGWAAALVKRDGAYFPRMLAPMIVYTVYAKMMSREDVLRDATSGTDSVTAAHNEDMVVHQAGPVTAVVTGLLVVEGRSAGKKFVHRYRFTDTWVKQDDGQW